MSESFEPGYASGVVTETEPEAEFAGMEIDTPLVGLIRKIGKEKAIRAWRRSRLAVEALAARLTGLHVRDVVRRAHGNCGQATQPAPGGPSCRLAI